MSLPDSVGDFISARYPALLADPDTQPEIYNSAASDYGVYASPELYGNATADDYVMYADINDYMLPAAPASISAPVEGVSVNTDAVPVTESASMTPTDDYLNVPMYGGASDTHTVTVIAGDTLYSISRLYGVDGADVAKLNNLSAPYKLSVGQKILVPGNGDIVVAPSAPVVAAAAPTTPATPDVINVPARTATPARVSVDRVTVGAGDTLYSISRRYSVPVNDLAVMNDLSAPFALTVGQVLKVPNLESAVSVAPSTSLPKTTVVTQTVSETKTTSTPATVSASPAQSPDVKTDKKTTTTTTVTTTKPAEVKAKTTPAVQEKAPAKKISSDPKQKLPKISARSSSKFSWPLRGKILSDFGAKSNGLFNDGINIGASRGTVVKAAENGVVAYAGNEVKGMGNLIILQHSGGWMTVYAHMDSMALRRGAKVSVGQKIGTVGATGKVDRPQLHFEIRKGTKAYNPSQYLKK